MTAATWVLLLVTVWVVLPLPLAMLVGRVFAVTGRAVADDEVLAALEAQVRRPVPAG